jgi:hypothetical protein
LRRSEKRVRVSSFGGRIVIAALIAAVPAAPGMAEAIGPWPQPLAATAGPGVRFAQLPPDRLVVTRTRTSRSNPNAPPYSRTIDDGAAVAKLYADVAALPPPPAGPLNCPMDLGISYHLEFYAGTTPLLAVDYEPTGCASVRLGDGTVRSAATGSFGTDLRKALGLSSDRELWGSP